MTRVLRKLLVVSLSLSTLLMAGMAYAGTISWDTTRDGKLTISGEGFTGKQPSYQVNVYLNDKFVTDLKTRSDGSFEYKIAANDGDEVTVKVLNFVGPGKHFEKVHRVVVTRPRPPAPQPQPPAPQPQPQPEPPFRATDAELRRYADIQARTVANRVAATYGELERWRNSFVTGFWSSYLEFEHAQVEGYPGSSDYAQGRLTGRQQGDASGTEAGRNEANNRAIERARPEAVSRFEAVLDRMGVQPDTVARVPQMAFDGFGYTPAPVTLDSKLDELDAQLQRELAALTWTYDGYYFGYSNLNQRWTLRTVYGYRGAYQFVEAWFRSDFALDEWKQNRLGGGYNYGLYNKLQSDQKGTFEAYFKSIYDNVIDEKFLRVARGSLNDRAAERGRYFGIQTGRDLAYQQGRNQGFGETYRLASRNAFFQTFPLAYRTEFERVVDFYNTHAVIEIRSASLFDGNRNGIFEAGERVGVEITKVVNLGRVEAVDMPVSLSGTSLTPIRTGQTVTLAPSSSNATRLVFKDLAQIDTNVSADQDNSAVLAVSVAQVGLAYKVSWWQVLDLFTKVDSRSSEFRSMHEYVMTTLRTEWAAAVDGRNVYSGKEGWKTRLGQLVSFYLSTRDQQARDILRGMRDEIRGITEPGGWKHPLTRSSFRDIVDQLK